MKDFPIRKWHEHAREVFSIDWSNVQKELFCTASWDCSFKLVGDRAPQRDTMTSFKLTLVAPSGSGHRIDRVQF